MRIMATTDSVGPLCGAETGFQWHGSSVGVALVRLSSRSMLHRCSWHWERASARKLAQMFAGIETCTQMLFPVCSRLPKIPSVQQRDCRFFRWDITYNMTHVGTQGPEIGARIALCKQPWRKQSSSLSCLYGSLYIETFRKFPCQFLP